MLREGEVQREALHGLSFARESKCKILKLAHWNDLRADDRLVSLDIADILLTGLVLPLDGATSETWRERAR